MRQAVRSLVKNPGFTTVAVLTLALGIGANTAVFNVFNAVLLQSLPYPNSDRIVRVWRVTAEDDTSSHSAPDYLDFQRDNRTVATLAAYLQEPLTILAERREPARVAGAQVTMEFFDVFGMPAALGRTFSRAAGDDRAGPLAILSYPTWRDLLAGDPNVIGHQLRINSVAHTIIGVMPREFDYPVGVRAWVVSPRPVPLSRLNVEGDVMEMRDVSYFNVIGLLKPETTATQAHEDFKRVADDIAARFPRTSTGRGVRVERLHDEIVGDVRRGLVVLLGAVAVVLLIACANVAGLLLARASGRQRELAVRAALGASRGRLLRHLLIESGLLAAAGGALGLLSGAWIVAILVSLMPGGVPRMTEITFDGRVAAACVLMSLVTALLVGIVPALQAAKTDASAVLRESGDRTSTGGRRRVRARSALVVGQLALTLVLLVSAGLLGNSFLRLQRTDPGVTIDGIAIIEIPLPLGKYKDAELQAGFYDRLLEALDARGEIEHAAVAFPRPFGGGNASGSFFIEGRPAPTRGEQPTAAIATISPDFFRTLRIPLRAGRHFTAQDRKPAPASIIVNATFAHRYFAGENAVGKRISFDENDDQWLTIVGVAADTRTTALANDPVPTMYLPYHYFTLPSLTVVARSNGGAAAVASAVRAAVRQIDPELPIGTVRPLGDVLYDSVAQPRFRVALLAAFAGTALLLAIIGVYGLVSYSVAQRTREIGIRVALGASSTHVIRPILREGMLLATVGVGLGLAGSFAVTGVMKSLLFGVDATDPSTFGAVAALLLFVVFLASYLPARRALRVDPLTALRAE